MDPNVAFGVFTYEQEKNGTGVNPNRELDLAEVSRWGYSGAGTCANLPVLCSGNSQFTLQDYTAERINLAKYSNINRYTIAPDENAEVLHGDPRAV
jgi:hypothetical protein